MIEAAGGTIVASPGEADVALFNSCAVTAEAEADLRQAVRRYSLARGGSPDTRTIVMGCSAARSGDSIAALPGVSNVIPGADLPAIAAALGLDPALAAGRASVQTGSRALLRIQDGCDEHCTFCATTLARGANRSRPAAELVCEAQTLAMVHPEIVLTGVHVGAYGADSGSSLGELVEQLVREVPVVRFRLSSIEATEIDVRLETLLAVNPDRVAPHVHAPLQSGSDRVLRRMGRRWYTADSYARAVERVVRGREVFALGADVISGFPGETESDHEETLALVRALPFTYLHVFTYSERPMTPAVRLGDRVSVQVAKRRSAELRALGEAKAQAYRARRSGGTADVVVVGEGARRGGLTEDYLSVALADEAMPRRSRFPASLGGNPLCATVAPAGAR